jgi:hypothetical protein
VLDAVADACTDETDLVLELGPGWGPEVKPELFEAIRGVAKRVTCIHFEPVGWQIAGYAGQASSSAYAEQHDYNRNLVECLTAEADAGRLVVDYIRPDVFGINPENSTTIIRWRSGETGP